MLLLVAFLATDVFAHPGHGTIPPDQPAHLLEPVHALPLLLIGLGAAAFAWRRLQRK